MSIRSGRDYKDRQAAAKAGKMRAWATEPEKRARQVREMVETIGSRSGLEAKEVEVEMLYKAHKKSMASKVDCYRTLAKAGYSDTEIRKTPRYKELAGQEERSQKKLEAAQADLDALKQFAREEAHRIIIDAAPGDAPLDMTYRFVGGKSKQKPQMVKAAKEATTWFTQVVRGKPLKQVYIAVEQEVRASYKMVGRKITLDHNDTTRVIIHELGHHLEYGRITLRRAAKDFLSRRAGTERVTPLSELTGNSGYDSNEVGVKDRFIHPYMGKHYNYGNCTEIVSMGLEYLYVEPTRLATQDPECFEFVLSSVWK
jgi:hypothetical protein